MISPMQSMMVVTMHAKTAMKPSLRRRARSLICRITDTAVSTNAPNANDPNELRHACPINVLVVPTNDVVPTGAKYHFDTVPPMTKLRA